MMTHDNKKPILTFTLKGKCIWGNTKGKECQVFGYAFSRYNKRLTVFHNLAWDIYTDETFEEEINKLIKKTHPELKIAHIGFSEQGLQENYEADMDVIYEKHHKERN